VQQLCRLAGIRRSQPGRACCARCIASDYGEARTRYIDATKSGPNSERLWPFALRVLPPGHRRPARRRGVAGGRVSWIPGGLIGVNIFFVISGFLISGIIFGECAAGGFSVLNFYVRRCRRIIPANRHSPTVNFQMREQQQDRLHVFAALRDMKDRDGAPLGTRSQRRRELSDAVHAIRPISLQVARRS
jgi:hypothetical protein